MTIFDLIENDACISGIEGGNPVSDRALTRLVVDAIVNAYMVSSIVLNMSLVVFVSISSHTHHSLHAAGLSGL